MATTDIYAQPNMSDSKGFFELFRYINTTANDLFFPVILLVIWMISFISLLGSGSGKLGGV